MNCCHLLVRLHNNHKYFSSRVKSHHVFKFSFDIIFWFNFYCILGYSSGIWQSDYYYTHGNHVHFEFKRASLTHLSNFILLCNNPSLIVCLLYIHGWYHSFAIGLFTADTLACHSKKSSGVTNNIEEGSVIITVPVTWQWGSMNNTRTLKVMQFNKIQPSLILLFILVILLVKISSVKKAPYSTPCDFCCLVRKHFLQAAFHLWNGHFYELNYFCITVNDLIILLYRAWVVY